MSYLIALIGFGLVGMIVTATSMVMRHREETRQIAREAEELDVMTDDTRRAMWISAADHHPHGGSHSDSSSGGGDAGGGD